MLLGFPPVHVAYPSGCNWKTPYSYIVPTIHKQSTLPIAAYLPTYPAKLGRYLMFINNYQNLLDIGPPIDLWQMILRSLYLRTSRHVHNVINSRYNRNIVLGNSVLRSEMGKIPVSWSAKPNFLTSL